MIVNHQIEQKLFGKHAVVLSDAEDITSQLSLKLALEGCKVFAISPDQQALQRLQREIDDIRGEFTYWSTDNSSFDSPDQIISHVQERIDVIDYFIDFTADMHKELSQALFQAYISKNVKHIILVGETRNDFLNEMTSLQRISKIQPIIKTQNGYAETAKIQHLIFVANEVLNLLIDENYDAVNDVIIESTSDETVVQLHTLAVGKTPQIQKTIRKGGIPEVYVRRTERGRGVFAGRDFAKGELILETMGKFVNHQTEHSLQIDWDLHVEPDAPVRLMNHSCDPSVGVKTNAFGFPDFFAFRDIRKGDEITFDYAMTEYTHYPRDNQALEFSLSCRCGSENCRGKLGYYSELPAELKHKYQGYISDYLMESVPRNGIHGHLESDNSQQ